LNVYLIQHAESVSEKVDPARPLSGEGKATMEKVAALAARLKIKPDFIFHSERLRAKQTAEILARNLGLSGKLRERHGLGPMDPITPIAGWLREERSKGVNGLAIVGHLPFLDRLSSILIIGNEAPRVVSFQNGAIVELVPRPDDAAYVIQSIITKEIAELAETDAR
jgi:phosphohistidine phosphatase